MLAAGIVWSGVAPENHLGGRVASSGYLQGKVILVDCRDYSADREALARLEGFWQGYRNKPFVLLGSHRGGDAARARLNLRAAGVSYPVYAEAAFESKAFEPTNGLLYVIHEGGRMCAKTADVNRAFEAAIQAITWGAVPSGEKQYRKLVDYELEVLPGKAYNHLKAMRAECPEAAGDYAEDFARLDADIEVKQVAQLELIARRVRDFDPDARKGGKRVRVSPKKVQELIAKAEKLKRSANPLIVQEVKNCIADLRWALAAQ